LQKYLINITFFVILGFTTSAQTTERITHYSIDNGLSQLSITSIFQSSDGILWIGTHDGLNYFDGYKFSNIRNNSTDTNSISNNYINDICEGENGNIIIATRNGITIWSRKNNSFKRINITNARITTIENNNVNQVVYNDKTIWALTNNKLIRINNNSIKNYPYTDTNNHSTTEFIDLFNKTNLILDKNKNLWFATPEGLEVFYPKSERFFKIYNNSNIKFSDKTILCILEKNNNFWLGTFNGLNKFIKKSGSFDSTHYYNNNFSNIEQNIINSIYIDKKNTFWIGTNGGLKTFDGNKICDFKNPSINAINNEISQIFEDNTNNIWIGTKYLGIYKISLNKSRFESFTDFPNNNKHIFSLFVDSENRIWVGAKGLYIIDKNTKKIIFEKKLEKANNVETIINYLYNQKKHVIATTNNGIYYIDKKTFKITSFEKMHNLEENNILRNKSLHDLLIDKKGVYWIASSKGLLKFDGKKFKTYLHNKNNKNSIASNLVFSVLEDGNKIWIGTNSGLSLLNTKTEKIKNFTTEDGLANNLITNFYKENDSILWITTAGGLSKFNLETEIFINIIKETYQLTNDCFYSIIPDKQNNLWLTSNYGIIKFNKTDNTFQTYSKQDGLPFLEFNHRAFYKTKDNLFFGGSGGIVWCDIINNQKKKKPLKVVITKLEIHTSFKDRKTILFPDSIKTYKIKYNKTLNIHFALPNYHNSFNNKYQYRIIGINEDWAKSQKENFISLIGLAPGKYSIQIKGCNSFNVWNNEYTQINIEIIPPFSKSIFSKILIIFLIISLSVTVFFFIYRNIKLENKILNEKNIVLRQIDIQKKLLEEKNKNITDSINYAKKIIEALLPPINQFQNILPKSFIFFVPKDIVSGDFYWFSEKNNNIFIASVDCTGHGIPGAFMSIIGINLLNSIVNEGISDPSIILNMMNKKVILTLKKTLDSGYLKDGMDMSLCVIDKKRKTINIASAYNPVYIIRDNNIIQFKGERKSVGNDFDFDSFSTFSVKIRKDDMVYLFSDGYTDQFGGAEKKKFKFRRFRFVLLSIYQLPPEKQKEKLKETIENWMASNEQVDDMLIIGFKPMSFICE